jgi:hypothetical protein
MEAVNSEPKKKIGGARVGAGRPPEITDDKLKKIYACRMLNLNRQKTADFVGVSTCSLDDWRNNADRVMRLLEDNEDALLSPRDQLYIKFAYVWNNAQTELQLGSLQKVQRAKDWKAHAWILERLATENFGRRETQPVIRPDSIEPAEVADEHGEFDPYEPERVARLILSFKEAGVIPNEVIIGIIENSFADAEINEIHSEETSGEARSVSDSDMP